MFLKMDFAVMERGEQTMPDKKQVMFDIERCICRVPDACRDCSKHKEGQPAVICMEELLKDALALLKEQEAVKPRVSTAEQRCGHCNKVIEMDGWQSCPW